MGACRHDWSLEEVQALYDLPFMDLLYKAHSVHRDFFDPREIQFSSLLSIKTGGCPEDCGYCPQSAHHGADLEKERLVKLEQVLSEAKEAKEKGATRFCMGAAWRNPNARDFPLVLEMIKGVKGLGMQCCVTLGSLDEDQASALKDAGLDYYNHNLDTSPEYYDKIITTRSFQDRLNTLEMVRDAGINVCCGGILGLGEGETDRSRLLMELANMPQHPDSVPINLLVRVKGTPLENAKEIDPFVFVRTIAVARIMMPKSYVRLSAGRESMDDSTQALCFFAGANSVFFGEKLLTAPNSQANRDMALLQRLDLYPSKLAEDNHDHERDPALTRPVEDALSA